jgi:hypothetical protein
MAQAHNNKLTIERHSDETEAEATARAAINPAVRGAITIAEFNVNGFDGLELDAMAKVLKEQVQSVNKGDLKQAEDLLISQALSLDAIFNSLAKKAINQDYIKQYETFFRLALKAQSQCTRTLEVLSAIKNPPIVYAKQANITSGPQQVNNGIAQTGNRETQQTELLEHTDGNRLDTGTKSTTSGINQDLEALGAIERT